MNAIRDEDPSAEDRLGGALAELIELELQIEARMAEAEAEAARIVEEARQSARSADEDGAGSLGDAVDALRQSIEQECAAEIRAQGERAAAEVARYRGVDDATLSRLAQWVARRVLRGADFA